MRTRDMDRLDWKLAELLELSFPYVHRKGTRQLVEEFRPTTNIAQALAAVEQAGLCVNTLSNMNGEANEPIMDDSWYFRLNTPERDFMGHAYGDTPALAVVLALIAALEDKK